MYNYFGLWAIGGIGRHARLKIWFSSESASSSLASPTSWVLGGFDLKKLIIKIYSKKNIFIT